MLELLGAHTSSVSRRKWNVVDVFGWLWKDLCKSF